MKNRSLKKLFARSFVFAALLIGSEAGAIQYSGSVERLFNACQQELQAYCANQDEPRGAFYCLQENEHQLFTRQCVMEMRLINRSRSNFPLPTEEPFRTPQDPNEIQ